MNDSVLTYQPGAHLFYILYIGKYIPIQWTSPLTIFIVDVRQFVCPVCTRAFKQKAHLSSHMLTHTGEKKMACQYCPKRFARRSDLRQHELQHTKERQYYCPHDDCRKVFYKLQNLRKHQKVRGLFLSFDIF